MTPPDMANLTIPGGREIGKIKNTMIRVRYSSLQTTGQGGGTKEGNGDSSGPISIP